MTPDPTSLPVPARPGTGSIPPVAAGTPPVPAPGGMTFAEIQMRGDLYTAEHEIDELMQFVARMLACPEGRVRLQLIKDGCHDTLCWAHVRFD